MLAGTPSNHKTIARMMDSGEVGNQQPAVNRGPLAAAMAHGNDQAVPVFLRNRCAPTPTVCRSIHWREYPGHTEENISVPSVIVRVSRIVFQTSRNSDLRDRIARPRNGAAARSVRNSYGDPLRALLPTAFRRSRAEQNAGNAD